MLKPTEESVKERRRKGQLAGAATRRANKVCDICHVILKPQSRTNAHVLHKVGTQKMCGRCYNEWRRKNLHFAGAYLTSGTRVQCPRCGAFYYTNSKTEARCAICGYRKCMDKNYKKAYQRAYYKRDYVKARLKLYCQRPYMREKIKLYQRNLYIKRRSLNQCLRCGSKVFTGTSVCLQCKEKARLRAEHRATINASRGLCVHCGKQRVSDGFRLCKVCRAEQVKRSRERSVKA